MAFDVAKCMVKESTKDPILLSTVPTGSLLDELERRNNTIINIGDKCEYCITADCGEDVCVCAYGPAKIMVVR